MKKKILASIFVFLFLGFKVNAQTAIVQGIVRDSLNKPIESANISIIGEAGGTNSDAKGHFQLAIPPDKDITIAFSFIGYGTVLKKIHLNPGENQQISVVLSSSETILPNINVSGRRNTDPTLTRIEPKVLDQIPNVSGNFEGVLKIFPGVVSNNELSSTYSVRGGNFDENLVYVNDVEIYRPFLVRSGEQEGLSFINGDLVSSINFSSGGFAASYGDKLSSVLDIKYKRPDKFAGTTNVSLIGGALHLEGASKNKKATYLFGLRQKSNQFILKSLDTKGDYKPSFTDLQGLVSYYLSPKTELSILANYSRNKYSIIPSDRETEFGNINEALKFTVFFDGQEKDSYSTLQGSATLSHQLNSKVRLRLITSAFNTTEREYYDIVGAYRLDELERDLGSSSFGDVAFNRGVGAFLSHARNDLKANVINAEHKGSFSSGHYNLQWGAKAQHESIKDDLNEFEYRDSADFSVPHPGDVIYTTHDTIINGVLIIDTITNYQNYHNQQVVFNNVVNTKISLSSNRYNGYMQNNWEFERTTYSIGLRATYWDFNKELNISPRASFTYKPKWRRNLSFRLASGFYYQPPFYREMRDLNGNINYNIKAQRSIHFVAATDYQFLKWGREFKFTAEAYYKMMDHLIPYKVDNVRIRYLANNNSKGYATGLDMRINGEFVNGVESWASLSLLKTEEDIKGDYYYKYFNSDGKEIVPGYTVNNKAVDSTRFEPGYIPRPTDQRVTFSLFFQDYLPKFPSYKMHITLVFGTGLPFGPPGTNRYKDVLRVPSYRRVDLGFSKTIIDEDKPNKSRLAVIRNLKAMWLSLEVFNLLQVNNTVSYTWITDVTARQYAVPNYLTSRIINVGSRARSGCC